jgi:hypothetical protein
MPRRLVEWEARHDNGWETIVREQPDGHFEAVTRSRAAVAYSSVSDSIEEARSQALAALKRSTGHHVCSGRCSEWAFNLKSSPEP